MPCHRLRPIWQKRSLTQMIALTPWSTRKYRACAVAGVTVVQLVADWYQPTSGSMQAAERLLHHGTSRYEWGHTSVDTPLTTLSISTQIRLRQIPSLHPHMTGAGQREYSHVIAHMQFSPPARRHRVVHQKQSVNVILLVCTINYNSCGIVIHCTRSLPCKKHWCGNSVKIALRSQKRCQSFCRP